MQTAQQKDCSENAFFGGEIEAEPCKVNQMLKDGAQMVHDEKKISVAMIPNVSNDSVTLIEALLFVRTLFSVFVKDKLDHLQHFA